MGNIALLFFFFHKTRLGSSFPAAGPACGEGLDRYCCHSVLAVGGRQVARSGSQPTALQSSGLGRARSSTFSNELKRPRRRPGGPSGQLLATETQTRRALSYSGPEGERAGYIRDRRKGIKGLCTVCSPTLHYSWASFLPLTPEDVMKRRETNLLLKEASFTELGRLGKHPSLSLGERSILHSHLGLSSVGAERKPHASPPG